MTAKSRPRAKSATQPPSGTKGPPRSTAKSAPSRSRKAKTEAQARAAERQSVRSHESGETNQTSESDGATNAAEENAAGTSTTETEGRPNPDTPSAGPQAPEREDRAPEEQPFADEARPTPEATDPTEPEPPQEERSDSVSPLGSSPTGTAPHRNELAFDQLYDAHAHSLTCQAYLLSGHRDIAERAVAHAFHRAWERWPEVSSHPDPVCWLRAAAHDYALSPWHLFHPARRRPQAHPGPPADRLLLDGLARLPRSYRRALLLHHGLGLDIADAADETEASLPATFGRVTNARAALAEHTQEVRAAAVAERPALITVRLRTLLAAHPVSTAPAGGVRVASERTTRRRTRAALGLTALVTTAVAAAWVTADDSSRRVPEGPPAVTSTSAPGGASRPGVYAPELRSSNDRVQLEDHVSPPPRPGQPGEEAADP